MFKGERGDSNPRIAAPQAAALTTWRRPPCAFNLPMICHFEISKCFGKQILHEIIVDSKD